MEQQQDREVYFEYFYKQIRSTLLEITGSQEKHQKMKEAIDFLNWKIDSSGNLINDEELDIVNYYSKLFELENEKSNNQLHQLRQKLLLDLEIKQNIAAIKKMIPKTEIQLQSIQPYELEFGDLSKLYGQEF